MRMAENGRGLLELAVQELKKRLKKKEARTHGYRGILKGSQGID